MSPKPIIRIHRQQNETHLTGHNVDLDHIKHLCPQKGISLAMVSNTWEYRKLLRNDPVLSL